MCNLFNTIPEDWVFFANGESGTATQLLACNSDGLKGILKCLSCSVKIVGEIKTYTIVYVPRTEKRKVDMKTQIMAFETKGSLKDASIDVTDKNFLSAFTTIVDDMVRLQLKLVIFSGAVGRCCRTGRFGSI